ncbi:MAG: spore photoproduct lyase family protein [bacterium]
MLYKPERIYVESQVSALRLCQRILQEYADVEQIVVDSSDAIPELSDTGCSITQGKKILFLKRYQGSGFKLCPGFSEEVLCCNYYVLDLIENCPLECTYCILQAFLNKPLIVFHLNVEEIVEQAVSVIKKAAQRPFRVGTGEHSDSLALDHIFQVNPYLIETFSALPNATLELKTKTDLVDPLVGLEHKGRTVVAWSLNPHEIIRENEFKTTPLEKRLHAAARMISEGYKVAFHFDPLIYYPDWRSGYTRTIELMFDYVSPRHIAWISLGTLRYIPILKQIAEERFPNISIFCNEFIPAQDGKMRYLKRIRMELLGTISGLIRKAGPEVPLYLCMEKHTVWEDIMPIHPRDAEALEMYLKCSG